MLSNERYTGQLTWNTHKWLRVPGKGTRRWVPRPASEHVTKTVEALRIVDAATWAQVQARVPQARAILMRVLRPFALTPDGDNYKISGALSLSAVVGPGVSEKSSSGGVI
jgi:hypothetical protein